MVLLFANHPGGGINNRDLFSMLCRKNIYFVEKSVIKRNNRPVWSIALDPVPLITSNFPLQETFGSFNVGVLQIPVHVCVCQWSVREYKRNKSRCKNMVGGGEHKGSQVQQPPVTRDHSI